MDVQQRRLRCASSVITLLIVLLIVLSGGHVAAEQSIGISAEQVQVSFGTVSPKDSPITFPYAQQLSIVSTAQGWFLEVSAESDFVAGANPYATIPAGRLSWALHSPEAPEWVPFSTDPQLILADQPPTPPEGVIVPLDFKLDVSWSDSPATYRTNLVYTVGAGVDLQSSTAWPNPFCPERDGETTISFCFGNSETVQIEVRITEPDGTLIWSSERAITGPGWFDVSWDGTTSPGNRAEDGQYYYRIEAASSEILAGGLLTVESQGIPGSYEISGTVRDSVNHLPVRGAGVRLYSSERRLIRSSETDETGSYTFTGLPAGRYYLESGAPGYFTRQTEVFELNEASSPYTSDFLLIPNNNLFVQCSFDSTDLTSGDITVATVSVSNPGTRRVENVVLKMELPAELRFMTHEEGELVDAGGGTYLLFIDSLEPGGAKHFQYIVATGPVLDRIATMVTVSAEGTTGTDEFTNSRLSFPVTISPVLSESLVRVWGSAFFDRDGNGKWDEGERPAAGATVFISPGPEIRTDAEGRFSLDLPRGRFGLSARLGAGGAEWSSVTRLVDTSSGVSRQVLIPLQPVHSDPNVVTEESSKNLSVAAGVLDMELNEDGWSFGIWSKSLRHDVNRNETIQANEAPATGRGLKMSSGNGSMDWEADLLVHSENAELQIGPEQRAAANLKRDGDEVRVWVAALDTVRAVDTFEITADRPDEILKLNASPIVPGSERVSVMGFEPHTGKWRQVEIPYSVDHANGIVQLKVSPLSYPGVEKATVKVAYGVRDEGVPRAGDFVELGFMELGFAAGNTEPGGFQSFEVISAPVIHNGAEEREGRAGFSWDAGRPADPPGAVSVRFEHTDSAGSGPRYHGISDRSWFSHSYLRLERLRELSGGSELRLSYEYRGEFHSGDLSGLSESALTRPGTSRCTGSIEKEVGNLVIGGSIGLSRPNRSDGGPEMHSAESASSNAHVSASAPYISVSASVAGSNSGVAQAPSGSRPSIDWRLGYSMTADLESAGMFSGLSAPLEATHTWFGEINARTEEFNVGFGHSFEPNVRRTSQLELSTTGSIPLRHGSEPSIRPKLCITNSSGANAGDSRSLPVARAGIVVQNDTGFEAELGLSGSTASLAWSRSPARGKEQVEPTSTSSMSTSSMGSISGELEIDGNGDFRLSADWENRKPANRPETKPLDPLPELWLRSVGLDYERTTLSDSASYETLAGNVSVSGQARGDTGTRLLAEVSLRSGRSNSRTAVALTTWAMRLGAEHLVEDTNEPGAYLILETTGQTGTRPVHRWELALIYRAGGDAQIAVGYRTGTLGRENIPGDTAPRGPFIRLSSPISF